MNVLEAYKIIPRRGNIVRLYEFRGRFCERTGATENVESMLKAGAKAKYMIVLAENLFDAVTYLHKCCPDFVPDKALCQTAMKIEPDKDLANEISDSGGSMPKLPGESTC